MDPRAKETPPAEALAAAAAVVRVSSTASLETVTSGNDAVLLKTSSTSIVVFPSGDMLKNRLPS